MNAHNYANNAYKHLKILTLIGIVGLAWTLSGTDTFAQSDPSPNPENTAIAQSDPTPNPENTTTADSNLVTNSENTTTSQESIKEQNKKYVFRRTPVFEYSTRGRRDPFNALVKEGYGDVKTDLLNVEEATLTGIVWGGDQMVAIFKDKDGKSHYMRKGSAVHRGRIVEISDNSVIVSLTQFGSTRRVEFKVTEHSLEASGG